MSICMRFCFVCMCGTVVLVMSKMDNVLVDNNGYTGLTVVISDKVEENNEIVNTLQNAFSEASKILYKASKYYVYFKDITIVVPKSWKNSGQYEIMSGSVSKNGDFLIEPSSNSNPHVFGQMECGGTGLYAHVTPEVVLSSRSLGYGALEKIIVHEWGHLRWGLFDEYPTTETPGVETPERFYNEDGTWKPIMCTDKILGRNLRDCNNDRSRCFADSETGKPDEDCKFCVQNPNTARASLMAYQWINSVVEFCDSEDNNVDAALHHNWRAPNDQNRLCNERSAWEVMRNHQDFKNPNNKAGAPTLDVTPTFKLVQEGDLRLVLLLDVSGSMLNKIMGPSRLQLLIDVVTHFLLYTVPNNTEVGIVSFSHYAQVEKIMTKVSSDAIREQLVKSIPQSASGSTSIGAGLRLSLETLNTTSSNLKGNIIILVTDGEENRTPLIRNVMPEVIATGIIVHTLGMGSLSDLQLSSIARDTNGKSSFYSEKATSTVLQDFFTDAMADSTSVIQLSSKAFVTSGDTPNSDKFYIDSSVGLNTIVQLVVNDSSSVNILVTGPDGQVYTSTTNTNSDSVYRVVTIPGTARVGKYIYSVTSTTNIQGTVSVQTAPKESGKEGLTIQSWTSLSEFTYAPSTSIKVYASIQQDKLPVLDVQVNASLENEDGDVVTIHLKDNGVGSDLRKNDAVYSAYILPKHVSKGGRLNIKMSIDNANGKAKQVTIVSSGSAPQSGRGKLVTSTQPLDNFQRVSQTGEIIVSNYTTNPHPDQLPPSKITDLQMASLDLLAGSFRVKWTAVGNDLDDGTATEYDIRLSSNYTQLKYDIDQASRLTQNVLKPKTSGETEYFTLTIPDGNQKTLYLTIRAKDDNQNIGDISNILSLSKITDSSWDPTTTTIPPTPSTVQSTARGAYSQNTESLVTLAVAVTLTSVILVLIGTAILYFTNNRLTRRKTALSQINDGKRWRSRQMDLPRMQSNLSNHNQRKFDKHHYGRSKSRTISSKYNDNNTQHERHSLPGDVKIMMTPTYYNGQYFCHNPAMYKY